MGEFEGKLTIGTKSLCHGESNCLEVPAVQLMSRGDSDVFIAKYDALDNLVWAVSGGGESRDVASGVVLDRWALPPYSVTH